MSQRYGLSVGRILHPTDFSHGSEVAFLHALRLAIATKGSLSILHVDREQKRPDWDRYPGVRETLIRWKLLPPEASRTDVASLGVHISKASVTEEDPASGVLNYLEEHPADLLVLATHQRHGLDRWLHRTIAGRINSRTDGATLFIPFGNEGFVDAETGACRLGRILLPADHDPDPVPAAEVASDLVQALAPAPAEIRLLHIGDPASAPGISLPANDRIHWHWAHRVGSVVPTILNEARDFRSNLITMTTAGRHGFFDALRGSTTEQVLEHAQCPVLAVHEWSD
ncbi:MAG: universal stress protein [Planctomycetaceae bacterium]